MLDCWLCSQNNHLWASGIKPVLQLWGWWRQQKAVSRDSAGRWWGKGGGRGLAELNQAETCIEGRRDGGGGGSGSDSSRSGAMGRGWSSSKWEAFFTQTYIDTRNRERHTNACLKDTYSEYMDTLGLMELWILVVSYFIALSHLNKLS